MTEIPAGSFIMGEDHDPASPQQEPVWLETYLIDAYEVTQQEFAEEFPDHVYPPGADRHPVTGLRWDKAKRFCERTGKRLPTAAEWEKAARGTDGRVFPWGDKKPRKKPHPYFSGLVKRRVGLNRQDISFFGLHDMAGSVWEWTADLFQGKRVARGGLWNLHLDYEYSKTFEKILIPPESQYVFLGFRCARSK